MKTKLMTLAAFATLSGPQAFADDPAASSLVMINARQVYVPNGFDDNDESLAVLDGYLPDTCYKLAYNEAKFDEQTKTFKVTQWARKFANMPCVEVMVPFFTEVSLGVLPAGKFTVKNGSAYEALTVKEAANAGPDDYTYAPVEEARIQRHDDGQYTGVIEGRFTNSCMAIEDVKVIDSGKTVEILPIMKLVTGADCQATEAPFSASFDLPATLAQGRHLLHVRSLNGKSINTMFSVVKR